eukprot:1347636-Amphidinium_carterae.1
MLTLQLDLLRELIAGSSLTNCQFDNRHLLPDPLDPGGHLYLSMIALLAHVVKDDKTARAIAQKPQWS